MKRIFCIIFSFYLLFLSWQPCQDLAIGENSLISDVSQTISTNNLPTSEDSDDCSPFCICSCCQISTVDAKFSFSARTIYTISAKSGEKIAYKSHYFGQFINSIWQPPKNFRFTA